MTDLGQIHLITSSPAKFIKGKFYGKAIESSSSYPFQKSTRGSRSLFSNRI
jgi:hypothetical protein